MKNAMSIVIISGTVDNLVRNPRIIKTEHKNSANTTKTKEIADPNPRKFINSILSLAISFSNFGKPCVNIDIPTNNRNTNINPLITVSLTFEELKFIICKNLISIKANKKNPL